MATIKTFLVWSFCVLVLVLLSVNVSIAQDKKTLMLGTGNPKGTALTNVTVQVFQPSLRKHSNGNLDVKIFFNGSQCSEQACGEHVRLGQLDIGQVSSGNMGAFGPTFNMIVLPYLFKDRPSASKVLNGWLVKEMRKRVEADMGFYLLGLTPAGGFRHLDNSVKEVRVPEDLKGVKIRVTKSPTEFSLLKAWGATAVPYDWPQLYQGIQMGVVQGMYIPDPYFYNMKFHEVVGHITHTGGAIVVYSHVMDAKRFRKLPNASQKAINMAADDMQRKSFPIDAAWIKKKESEVPPGRVTVYKPTAAEMKLWYKGATAAWLAVKGSFDTALARRILEDQGQTELIQNLEKAGAL